jgi:hypothetical protein
MHKLQEQPRASASSSGNGSTPSSRGSAAPRSTQNGSGSTDGAHCGEPTGSRKNGSRKQQITARLLVDCMGHYSPVVKQMRGGSKPEAMVLVLGGCADGVPPELNRWVMPLNASARLIVS